jgi:DNA end-binding protein Ku
MRASWKGYLKLALVSCPVRLFKATSEAERLRTHFRHQETMNRIQMVPVDPELGNVARHELVNAYEPADGRYVVLSEAELAEIRTPCDKTLAIESFVERGEIDPVYIDQPYYLVPDGPVATETFDLLRQTMTRRKKAAIARIVLGRRERLAAIMVRDRGFLMVTLRNVEDVRDSAPLFDRIEIGKPGTELTNLAEQLVAVRSGRFDPHMFRDRYQVALAELIDEKLAHGEVRQAAPAATEPEEAPLTLAEAFRRSLEPAPPARMKPPARSRRAKPRQKPEVTAPEMLRSS